MGGRGERVRELREGTRGREKGVEGRGGILACPNLGFGRDKILHVYLLSLNARLLV